MCIYIFQFILKEIKILSRLNTKIRYFSMFLHDRKQYGFHDCKFLVSIGKFEDGPYTMSFLPIPGDSDNFSWEKKKKNTKPNKKSFPVNTIITSPRGSLSAVTRSQEGRIANQRTRIPGQTR